MSPAPLDPFDWMRLPQTRAKGEKARRDVRRRGGAAIRADERIAALEAALERSMVMNLALWELASDKLKLKPKDLEAKLSELDRRTASGESEVARDCVACGRSNRVQRVRCFFCGDFTALPEASEFTSESSDSEASASEGQATESEA